MEKRSKNPAPHSSHMQNDPDDPGSAPSFSGVDVDSISGFDGIGHWPGPLLNGADCGSTGDG